MIFATGEVMKANVPTTTVIGIVSGKDIHLRADRDFQNVPCAGRVNF